MRDRTLVLRCPTVDADEIKILAKDEPMARPSRPSRSHRLDRHRGIRDGPENDLHAGLPSSEAPEDPFSIQRHQPTTLSPVQKLGEKPQSIYAKHIGSAGDSS